MFLFRSLGGRGRLMGRAIHGCLYTVVLDQDTSLGQKSKPTGPTESRSGLLHRPLRPRMKPDYRCPKWTPVLSVAVRRWPPPQHLTFLLGRMQHGQLVAAAGTCHIWNNQQISSTQVLSYNQLAYITVLHKCLPVKCELKFMIGQFKNLIDLFQDKCWEWSYYFTSS